MRYLNLGCGTSYNNDWINIDFKSNDSNVIEYNLLDGIPLKEESVDVVYHSHVLEHFNKNGGVSFLKECYRVLRPNGIIRIAVPDLEVIAREYLKNLEIAKSGNHLDKLNYDWIKLEMLDQLARHKSGGAMMDYLKNPNLPNEEYIVSRLGQEVIDIRKNLLEYNELPLQIVGKKSNIKKQLRKARKWIKSLFLNPQSKKLSEDELYAQQVGSFRLGGEVHQWMYDEFSLECLLTDLGFKHIKRVNAYKSNIPNWQNFNLDVADNKTRKPDSLFIEAFK